MQTESAKCSERVPLRGFVVISRRQHPRIAGCHASKRAGWRPKKEGTTYRPRSVSSLLIRLRAMALCVVVCVCVLGG